MYMYHREHALQYSLAIQAVNDVKCERPQFAIGFLGDKIFVTLCKEFYFQRKLPRDRGSSIFHSSTT